MTNKSKGWRKLSKAFGKVQKNETTQRRERFIAYVEFKFDGKWQSQLKQGTCTLILVSVGLGTNNLENRIHVIFFGFT